MLRGVIRQRDPPAAQVGHGVNVGVVLDQDQAAAGVALVGRAQQLDVGAIGDAEEHASLTAGGEVHVTGFERFDERRRRIEIGVVEGVRRVLVLDGGD